MSGFAAATSALAGPLPARLVALREAGFEQAVLTASDLAAHPAGWDEAVQCVRASGLRIVGLEVTRDFRGLAAAAGGRAADVAMALLTLCRNVGTRTLVVRSPPGANADVRVGEAALADDLRKLALLAIPLGVRIAWRGPGRETAMWAEMVNLGLCLDAAEWVAGDADWDELEALDIRRVFLAHQVDLGDTLRSAAFVAFARRLHATGYRGAWSLGGPDADTPHLPPRAVARSAFAAAQWIEESVLHRALAVPRRRAMPA